MDDREASRSRSRFWSIILFSAIPWRMSRTHWKRQPLEKRRAIVRLCRGNPVVGGLALGWVMGGVAAIAAGIVGALTSPTPWPDVVAWVLVGGIGGTLVFGLSARMRYIDLLEEVGTREEDAFADPRKTDEGE